MNRRRLLVALPGLAIFAVAVLVILDPAAGELFPVREAVSVLGFDYLLVAIVGAMALVVALLVLAWRNVGGLHQATPPAPERVEPVPRFGGDLDAVFEGGAGIRARLLDGEHRHVRERLRKTAVGTVMRVSNCSHAEAAERVAAGTWTDDPEAAAFLSDRGDAPGDWWTRLLSALEGETPFRRGARRSAEAIVAHARSGGDAAGRRGPAEVDTTGERLQEEEESTSREVSA